MDKFKVVVGRKWNNPEIYLAVTQDKIEMKMDLKQFINSLVEQSGNPTLLVTKKMLEKKLLSAAEAITNEMKSESKHVV